MPQWSHTFCAKTHSICSLPLYGKAHNKPADVKFNTSSKSFALISVRSHTAAGSGNWVFGRTEHLAED